VLNICRFAGSTSFLGWYAIISDPELSEARQVLLYHSVPAFDRLLFCVFSIKSPTSTGEIAVTTCRAPYGGMA